LKEFGVVQKMNTARVEFRGEADASVGEPAQQPFLCGGLANASAVESPARRLQLELQHSLVAPEPSQWSKRRALAFIVITSAVLWSGLMAGARALL
jgi:hypothetical protein